MTGAPVYGPAGARIPPCALCGGAPCAAFLALPLCVSSHAEPRCYCRPSTACPHWSTHAAAAAGCPPPPLPGRRRPFLVKALENVLQKFVMGLEFYDDEGRHKIAIGERH